MKVRWTRRAHRQLEEALTYISDENPIAAGKMAQRIYAAEQLLSNNPEIGRPGRISGTREWAVRGAPYLMGYTANGDELIILALLHSKQQWPARFE